MRHDEGWASYCERWLAAWTGGRVDAIVRWYAEDCLYADPRCPQGIIGKAALRVYMGELLEQYPDWVFRFRECGRTSLGVYVTWWIAWADCRHVERLAGAELILRDGRIVQQQSVWMMDGLGIDSAPDRWSNDCRTRAQYPPEDRDR